MTPKSGCWQKYRNIKKFMPEFLAAVVPKLRPGIALNFGGRQSHEFAIFVNFFVLTSM